MVSTVWARQVYIIHLISILNWDLWGDILENYNNIFDAYLRIDLNALLSRKITGTAYKILIEFLKSAASKDHIVYL